MAHDGGGEGEFEAERLCKQFLKKGSCSHGEDCKFIHAMIVPSDPKFKPGAQVGSKKKTPKIDNPLNRCAADLAGEPCPYGSECWNAHRSAVNPKKDADKDIRDKIKKAGAICKCCGVKGHDTADCRKLAKHAEALKQQLGYNGDVTWFNKPDNTRRSIALFTTNQQWRMETHEGHLKQTSPSEGENEAPPLPYKLEENWTDGGWCTLGSGEFELEVRLFLDLGSQRSFGSLSLYKTIVENIKKGNMGAARVATEIRNQVGEGWHGGITPMTNWIETTVEADNAAGTPTIVPGTMIAFCRDANDEIIVAGKDLCARLGYWHPKEQRNHHRNAVPDHSFLKRAAPARTYVLSKSTKEKIAENRRRSISALKVRSQGTAFIGSGAFNNTKLTMWAKEPSMRSSYITSACLGSAGSGAGRMISNTNGRNEINTPDHQAVAD